MSLHHLAETQLKLCKEPKEGHRYKETNDLSEMVLILSLSVQLNRTHRGERKEVCKSVCL